MESFCLQSAALRKAFTPAHRPTHPPPNIFLLFYKNKTFKLFVFISSITWSLHNTYMLTLQTCKSLDPCFLALFVKHVSQSINIYYLHKVFMVILFKKD